NADLPKIAGIGWRNNGQIVLNAPEKVVPQERMDIDMPGYAWDLLPFKNKPFDMYRAHLWHADFQDQYKTPFAALYTSLGCRFKCDFCMINIVNRTDYSDDVPSNKSNFMRYWSPELILKEFDKLQEHGVNTVRLVDEMFFLDKRYYEPLLKGLVERGYGDRLRMWSYSRVDTVRKDQLELFRKAGMRWFCLGIEAASQNIRREVTKGTFQEINIRKVVQEARDADISIIANYMFGLPDDTLETMQQTLDLGLEMNTEMWNGYACMALPGSPLYYEAKKLNMKMPDSYAGYGFLSYDCQPMATKYLSAADIMRFRDAAFEKYFNYQPYLDLVQKKFGPNAIENINGLKKVKLKRKILGD
ncbi:MAG TPA: radical SAM protein, partial [Pyrinomonadaceae bacterium]|nr:radical SAM protein [Pyrinomonadaceae bacterium]